MTCHQRAQEYAKGFYLAVSWLDLPSKQTKKNEIVEELKEIMMKKWAGNDTPQLAIKEYPISRQVCPHRIPVNEA